MNQQICFFKGHRLEKAVCRKGVLFTLLLSAMFLRISALIKLGIVFHAR